MTLSLGKRSLCLFVYLLVLDGVAIFFFTRGFLLTRTELSVFSECSDVSNCPSCFDRSLKCHTEDQQAEDLAANRPTSGLLIDSHCTHGLDEGAKNVAAGTSKQVNDFNEGCWTLPAIKKAVILIIDALRFDFVAHSRNFNGEPKPWMDKLSILQRLVEEQNSTARIFKFIADPPTTTLQRLKGITTGGLPTFIDIGHSFGAPAIAEDNLISQLQRTGKRVVMMGDDTWMQLFPTQFSMAYPFPSYNVKDLHTVDDGVIRELFPALHRNDWDVLIGHFLGVDHVGHIFGVESPLMVEKLKQYNDVIENVATLLKNMSEPGGLLEDTLLIVMGDHGQTLNGDHGGGTPEEVETALFALSTHHNSRSSLPESLKSCEVEDPVIGCISSIPQLDFSASMSSFLGVPFPYGSVGQVNAELFDLVARDAVSSTTHVEDDTVWSKASLTLMEHYKEVLCINSWQVKRYFEAYSAVAISGFPPQDLARLTDLYSTAQNINTTERDLFCSWASSTDESSRKATRQRILDEVQKQVEAFREYLKAAAALARSQWTQFGIEWMVVGLSFLIASVVIRAAALRRLSHSGKQRWEAGLFPTKPLLINSIGASYPIIMLVVLHPLLTRTPLQPVVTYIRDNLSIVVVCVTVGASVMAYLTSSPRSFSEKKFRTLANEQKSDHRKWSWDMEVDFRSIAATVFVILHGFSLFSNSYIVAEESVINYLMASSSIVYLRYSIKARSKIVQALCFMVLVWVLPRVQTLALFKGMKAVDSSGPLYSTLASRNLLLQVILTCTTVVLPLLVVTWILRCRLGRSHYCAGRLWKTVRSGVSISYFLIGVYWIIMDLTNTEFITMDDDMMKIVRLYIPRIIYMTSVVVVLATITAVIFSWARPGVEVASSAKLLIETGASVAAGSSGTILLLMGRRGPLISMLVILEVWCFLELQAITTTSGSTDLSDAEDERKRVDKIVQSFGATADWSMVALQLFFSTGHSCAFDGLHFSAAFIGFDDFGFYQQGILLAVETFGASHLLPVFGLPVIILLGQNLLRSRGRDDERMVITEVTKGYLWFGTLRAIIAVITTASVCIQRRHLMVWGIFAPKFVFDALGFLVLDVLVILATAIFLIFRRPKQHEA
ncbi:GPI ethanolamine phosphate transferase 3 subunit O [Marchantia polymorpha subsp. ruderalis]|uniref:GPI ethanolamine phosphate transferase 3 n=2 Tax=Marchantia polymorpha TaxID=3197 RepID=A0AAF6BF95_MARPO|nr:hypothetical protein MARPO_0027s0070 [Marchantia polymorpha]BBN10679.1 hypothetical protein Mp_5g05550 [Marchantia polymorpha subsp. ruderalis]|eukprot:PTQ42954.1 hypothetical protein MARPO_0027s0070 [Marchantia polymorpha]